MTLQELIEWQEADAKDRSAKIEIREYDKQVWVYSYKLMTGKHYDINSPVSEIDLEALKEEEEREKYEQLKVKYGS